MVIPLEGNGARPSHHGDGYRKSGPMYSLNTTEVHSIAYAFEPGILKREGKENRVCEEVTPTIREHMGDNQTAVAYTVDMGGGKSSVCTYQEQSPTTAARTLSKSQPKTCAVIVAVENDPTLKIDTEGVGFSLRAREFKDPQIVCYPEKRFCEWYEDEKSVTLRASSGSYGGGSEVLVCTKEQRERTKCG